MPRATAHAAHVAAATAVAVIVMALVSGCDVVSSLKNDGVSNPITPDQSKAQVVDAANEIVGILNLQTVEPAFWRTSCNDQGGAPFRGQIRIGYPLAPSFEASDAEVARMVEELQSNGWTTDPGSLTHGTAITKNNVVAIFYPQSVSDITRGLELLGECRDVTTTKETKGNPEIIDLPAS